LFKPCVIPIHGETVIAKTTNSAFVGTTLRETLATDAHSELVIAGVKTNNSVETTIRHGGNLGYHITLLADACFTFDQIDWNGKYWPAEDVHAMSLSNMDGEYCHISTVDGLIAAISA